MISAFETICNDRKWNDSKWKMVLNNIQRRLERRLPKGEPLSLTEFQKTVLSNNAYWRDWSDHDNAQHMMIQGSTSAGKTLISELSIIDTLSNDRKAIVLVPLKAMVHERTLHFREDMGNDSPEYGLRVYGSSGDYIENDERLIEGEFEVAIIVYEKFFAMLSQGYPKFMRDCGLLVVDELSMLGSEQRGPKLEMAMEIVRRKYTETRIMCLATSDCSTQQICQWLKIEKPIVSTARPVALEEHILDLSGTGKYRIIPKNRNDATDPTPLEEYEEKIIIPNYRTEWRTEEKQRQLLLAVISKIQKDTTDARLLVFVSSQSMAAKIAEYLNDNLAKWQSKSMRPSNSADSPFLEAVKACDIDEGQEKLIHELLPNGIAYHHAGISTAIRELIEDEFSKEYSSLHVIVATETLTVGVNMPFDAMIMISNLVPRGTGIMMPLTQQEYRNYIGRAGRLGQSNRPGKTYLFAERERDRTNYWNSYYNKEEVTSALTKAGAEVIAPYFLSLLNNRVQIANTNSIVTNTETIFTIDALNDWYEDSLSRICGNTRFNAERVHEFLYKGYLVSGNAEDSRRSGPMGRGENDTVRQYKIERFGSHMASYAFSIDTCIRIFWFFYEGYKHDGMPCGVSQEDVAEDRYLLEILYHVCRHSEMEMSTNILYPKGDTRVNRGFDAKRKVLSQLQTILTEKNENGLLRNRLWCDVNENARKEDSDLWLLINSSNLEDEEIKLQAAMRAIVLYYWTKGFETKQINERTGFNTFTKVITGDIERLADVASFHLDAIYNCLQSAFMPGSNEPVYQDKMAEKEFYALTTRVKYGMPRSLVVLANKHIHGLDRKRLLRVLEMANKDNLTPIQYLFLTPPNRIPDSVLTVAQHNQLRLALEERGSVSSINTLMGIVERDLAADCSSDYDVACLREIASWGDTDRGEDPALDTIYNCLRKLRNNGALKSISILNDGAINRIVWNCNSVVIRIGVLVSDQYSEGIFGDDDDIQAKILIVPNSFSEARMHDLIMRYHANAVIDNVFLTFVLANAIRLPLDGGAALTEMLADLKGVFIKADYSHFPLRRYIEETAGNNPKYRLIYGSQVDRRFEGKLNLITLESMLRANDEIEILPWGRALFNDRYDFSKCPTIILLDRADVQRSESLTRFIYIMRNQRFHNCLLLLESENAEQAWNSTDDIVSAEMRWNNDFNLIQKRIVSSNHSAQDAILSFVRNWKHQGYLVGISYAHYDPFPSDRMQECNNDIAKLCVLAEKLKEQYGEDRILFDRFEPAKYLFGSNRGKKKSLEAYEQCRLFLVLWNIWTKENENCKKELETILKSCKNDRSTCMFLQTGNPSDPTIPDPDYYSTKLSTEETESLVNRVGREISRLLTKEVVPEE